jgi:hypothetical protein
VPSLSLPACPAINTWRKEKFTGREDRRLGRMTNVVGCVTLKTLRHGRGNSWLCWLWSWVAACVTTFGATPCGRHYGCGGAETEGGWRGA